jgi:hypothetical protein
MSTPNVEDAQRLWTGRTRCLEVAKWLAEGVLGGAHLPPLVDAVTTHRLERTAPMACRVGTTVTVSLLKKKECVSLDGALNSRDVCHVCCRGLQAVWLLEMFERTPLLFQ